MTAIAAKIVGVVVVVIGLVASILTLLPRITVDSSTQTDPSNPYPIPFTITNTGYVSLANVQPAIGLCRLWTKDRWVQGQLIKGKTFNATNGCEGALGVRMANAELFTKHLALDERHVIRLDDLIYIEAPDQLGGADISIIVSYEPWIIPLRRTAEFRFFTREERDGKLSWTQRPLVK